MPDYQKTLFCEGCQRQCSAPEVLRCQMKGKPVPELEAQPLAVKPKKTDRPVQVSRPPRMSSGIGDCLKAYFDKIGAKQQEGCSCEDIRLQLNKRPPELVLQELDNWVDSVMTNVKYLKGVKGALIKAVNLLLPNTLRTEVKSELLKCMEEAKARLSKIAQDAPKTDPDSKDDSTLA